MSALKLTGPNDAKWLRLLGAVAGYAALGPAGGVVLSTLGGLISPIVQELLEGVAGSSIAKGTTILARDVTKDKIKASLSHFKRLPPDANHHLRRALVRACARSLIDAQNEIAAALGVDSKHESLKKLLTVCNDHLSEVASAHDVSGLDKLLPPDAADLDLASAVDQFLGDDGVDPDFWAKMYDRSLAPLVVQSLYLCDAWTGGAHKFREAITAAWPDRLPAAFAEVVKGEDSESRKAWVGYQRLLLTHTRSLIQDIGLGQQEVRARLDEVFAIVLANQDLLKQLTENTVASADAKKQSGDEILEAFKSHLADQAKRQNEILQALQRQNLVGFGKIITSQEFVPSSDPSVAKGFEGVMTGQRVTPRHLAYEMVAERPLRFTSLWKAFEDWSFSAAPRGPKIPVFWISGRSGEGKSVLRMQLIRELARRHTGENLFELLGGDKLAPYLTTAQSLTDPGALSLPSIICADDLFDVADRESWSEGIKGACSLGSPNLVVLTCGPTEQMREFKATLGDQFEVTHFEVPPVTAEELPQLAQFATRRLGRRIELELPSKEDAADTLLLVQLMFVAAQGTSLSGFADRFHKRMELAGIAKLVEQITALNAIYLHAPVALISSDHERDQMAQLCAEDQLHFEVDSGKGIRLLHPHLAWLLLREWAGHQKPGNVSLPVYWARLLAQPLELFHNLEPRGRHTSSLLHVLRTTSRLSPESSRATFFAELYRKHIAAHDRGPSAQTLPRWMEIADKVAPLDPSPFNAAIRWLESADIPDDLHCSAFARLFVAAPILFPERAESIRGKIETLFLKPPTPFGAGFALAYLLTQSGRSAAVHSLARKWVDANPTHPQAYWLLSVMVARDPAPAYVIQVAYEMLPKATWKACLNLLAPLLVREQLQGESVLLLFKTLEECQKQGDRMFLLINLGKAASHNLPAVAQWLQAVRRHGHHPPAEAETWNKRCWTMSLSVVKGMMQNPKSLQFFAELEASPARDFVNILTFSIRHDLRAPNVDQFIGDWLDRNYRRPGYGAVLMELRKKPGLIKDLKTNNWLTSRVDCDLQSDGPLRSPLHRGPPR